MVSLRKLRGLSEGFVLPLPFQSMQKSPLVLRLTRIEEILIEHDDTILLAEHDEQLEELLDKAKNNIFTMKCKLPMT